MAAGDIVAGKVFLANQCGLPLPAEQECIPAVYKAASCPYGFRAAGSVKWSVKKPPFYGYFGSYTDRFGLETFTSGAGCRSCNS